jgi:hypothetical protein
MRGPAVQPNNPVKIVPSKAYAALGTLAHSNASATIIKPVNAKQTARKVLAAESFPFSSAKSCFRMGRLLQEDRFLH